MKVFGLGSKNTKQQAPIDDAGPVVIRDAAATFPRGLPGGDNHKPSATARWPSTAELADAFPEWRPWRPGMLGREAMFLIGKDHTGRYYGHADDRHILTVAGSRAGKGTSLVVPNLIHWPGSVLAIDPKAELASLTAPRRSALGSSWSAPLAPGQGKVFALDPFDRVTGEARHHSTHAAFNPMAGLDPTTGDGLDRAFQIADALIYQSDGDGAHWTQSALALLRALILFVVISEPPTSANLITVRRLVTRGAAKQNTLWELMVEAGQKEGEAYDLVARTGETMQGRTPGERSSILSSIETQTAFLEGPEMKRVLSDSSFRLEDLKTERVTVYLCLPAARLATHGKWLRMMVTLAMDAMERTGPIDKHTPSVLFCLDEFSACGPMQTVESAAGQIASFGVKLWPILQDIPQLKRNYPLSWETFMGNAGLLTFFGNSDLTTTEHISKRLGVTEVVRTVVNRQEGTTTNSGSTVPDGFSALLGAGNARTTQQGVSRTSNATESQTLQNPPLLNPDEIVRVFARETNKLLALVPGKPPCPLYRCVHHSQEDDALFGGTFEEIPGQDPPRTTRAKRQARDGTDDGAAPERPEQLLLGPPVAPDRLPPL